jgi:hypothetical protein
MPQMQGANERDVRGFARIAWLSSERGRRHETVPGAIAIHSEGLSAIFGQKRFAPLNQKHGVFEVIRAAIPGRSTDAYRLRPDYDEAMQRALDESDERDEPAVMIRPDGRRRRAPVIGIERESLRGTKSIWRSIEIRTVTPLQLDALRALRDELRALTVIGGPLREARLEAFGLPRDSDVMMLLRYLRPVLHRARAELPRRGFIATEYMQVDTGRLFESEPGLQGAPRPIKRVALGGLGLGLEAWDVSNCHPTIIKQLAERRGLTCPVIAEYLERKAEVRGQLERDVGLTTPEVKSCLLAVFYGSRQRCDDTRDAVHKEVGLERSKAFFAHPFVGRLIVELKRVGPAIERAWPRSAGGYLINAAGMAYNGKQRVADDKKDTPSTRLAHIVQGFEVAALHAVVTAFGDKLVLLEHDGWTSRLGLDRAAVEAVILQGTGLRLSVECEPITASTAGALLKREIAEIQLEQRVASVSLDS